MSELTLRQLEYFAAIAETGSVTEAAARCHVTQAAVSLGLAQLEQSVGAPLAIRRRGKGLALTPEGQAVAARARLVTDQVAAISAAVNEVHGQLSGRLVVGVFRTLSVHAIPPLVDWFATRHPGVQLDFLEGSGPGIQDAMLAGRCQFCVIYETQLAPDCTAERLASAYRHVVLSPEHPLAGRRTLRLEDLAGYPAMLLGEEPALQRTIAEFAAVGVEPRVVWHSASVPAIHNVVGRNLAYSLLNQPVAASPEGRPLVFVPLADPAQPNAIMASRPPGIPASALVAEAMAALRAHWAGEQ